MSLCSFIKVMNKFMAILLLIFFCFEVFSLLYYSQSDLNAYFQKTNINFYDNFRHLVVFGF